MYSVIVSNVIRHASKVHSPGDSAHDSPNSRAVISPM